MFPLLLDGPMGTELQARGLALPEPLWSAIALEAAPALVREIHAAYVSAGAEVHRTNTFRTQPTLDPRWRTWLERAVVCAREGGATRVAGSIAPVRDCYRPDLSPPADEARVVHRAVATALAPRVDLLVCETFPHGGEAAIAVAEATKTGKPTWVALTAGPDASLMTPAQMGEAARACIDEGASAVLVSCTAATATLRYVEALARVSSSQGVPFGAYANAGAPEDEMGWSSGAGATARYVACAETWVAAGATIVGACCGCGPAHVAAMRDAFK